MQQCKLTDELDRQTYDYSEEQDAIHSVVATFYVIHSVVATFYVIHSVVATFYVIVILLCDVEI